MGRKGMAGCGEPGDVTQPATTYEGERPRTDERMKVAATGVGGGGASRQQVAGNGTWWLSDGKSGGTRWQPATVVAAWVAYGSACWDLEGRIGWPDNEDGELG
ncbi:hypothetical protein L1987_02420 [Smallanthus sonchifolius]|uniref:Uncharacterized protein n=1 Tax=Smallanthus sonchifolius TaxID=185202 RepID=A0ACB9K7Y9_9ASTR|nr:hypothetical protein L1987_02420 [Smallanthus sonchifolius]